MPPAPKLKRGMPKAGSEETITDDKHFVHGAFILVSSDSVRFKLPSEDIFTLALRYSTLLLMPCDSNEGASDP